MRCSPAPIWSPDRGTDEHRRHWARLHRKYVGRSQHEGDRSHLCEARRPCRHYGRYLSGAAWEGSVDSIAPASGSEFSILPAQNSSGNWVKVVQRIAVRGSSSIPPPASRALRAGMSVTVEIDTGHRKAGGFALTAEDRRFNPCPQRALPEHAAPHHHHRLHHARHADAGAGHHDRQRRAALHAGLAGGHAGPDHLGPDLLYRRRGDHDRARRLAGGALRPQGAVRRLPGRLHGRFDDVRRGRKPGTDGRFSGCCRACSAQA